MNTPKDLATLLNPYDKLDLECDGFTRIADYLLTSHDVPHTVKGGTIIHVPTGRGFSPHFWIETIMEGQTITVDYRARMWLPDIPEIDVPHGVFNANDFPAVRYRGQHVSDWQPTDKTMFDLLVATARTTKEVYEELLAKSQEKPDGNHPAK